MSGIAERLAGAIAAKKLRGCPCAEYRTCCARCMADALLPVVEREIAAARGEAWDEGYTAADFAVHRGIVNPCAVMDRGNPYRAALSPDPDRGEGEVGDEFDPDDEEFCPKCFAGLASSEHHEKCEADR